MRILFILSLIGFIYLFMRIKKTNKKENIILWILLSLIIFMCYNSIVILLLSFINVTATLLIRSIVNIIIIGILFLIFRKKEKQLYYFEYKDIIVVGVMLLVTIVICHFRFGLDLGISFKVDDPAYHYSVAERFYKTSDINTSLEETNVYGSGDPEHRMFFSYTNLGTFFQLGDIIVGEFNLYKLYIIFELFSFFMSGILFYYLIRKDKMSKINYLFVIIITLLYVLGYSLNNLLYGFHYWGLSILVISCLLILLKLLFKEKIVCPKLYIIICMLVSLSIFSTYYMLIPAVYGGIGLYILYLSFIEKKFKINKSLILILFILFIPFVLGCSYYILPSFFDRSEGTSISAMIIEGDCYKNLIINFIFLLPFIIYKIINDFKNKNNIETFIWIITVIYLLILLFCVIIGKASSYYFYKPYYLLWLCSYIILGKCLDIDNKEFSKIFKYYLVTYIFIIIIGCSGKINSYLLEKNDSINNESNFARLGDIYANNYAIMMNEEQMIDSDTVKLLKYVDDNREMLKCNENEIAFVGTYFQKMWINTLIDIIPSYDYEKRTELWANNMGKMLDSDDVKYIVWINGGNYIDVNNYNIIYENKAGYVLEKKDV